MDALAIDQLPFESLAGTRVMVRIDPSESVGATLPTLEYLMETGSRIVVVAGSSNPVRGSLAPELSRLLGHPVRELSEPTGGEARRTVFTMRPKDVVLLQNLSANPQETANDPGFARHLATLAEIYCNDDFSDAHHTFASTVGVTRYVEVAVAGLRMARQIARIEGITEYPEPPVGAIVGGTSLAGKLPLLTRLAGAVDWLFVGGALSFAFLKAKGVDTGAAPVDEELLPIVNDVLTKAEGRTEVILPIDLLAVDQKEWGLGHGLPAHISIRAAPDLLPSEIPMDIGPQTIRQLETLLSKTRTLFWNGPLGVWEVEPFRSGTREVARLVAARASAGMGAVVCGGDLEKALRSFDLPYDRVRDLILPSRATLQLVAGRPLPALEALRKDPALLPSPVTRALLPVNDSEELRASVGHAGVVLQSLDAEIHLLFCGPQQDQEEAPRAFSLANSVLARYGLCGCEQVVRQGDPAECILNYAVEMKADLVLARRSEPPKIYAGAKCSTLFVRRDD
jgi:phosphoglycerate kinase